MNETREAEKKGAECDNIHENGALTFFAFSGRLFQTENSNSNNLPAFNFAVSSSSCFVDCCEKRFTVTLLLFISGERQSMRAHFSHHFFLSHFQSAFHSLAPSLLDSSFCLLWSPRWCLFLCLMQTAWTARPTPAQTVRKIVIIEFHLFIRVFIFLSPLGMCFGCTKLCSSTLFSLRRLCKARTKTPRWERTKGRAKMHYQLRESLSQWRQLHRQSNFNFDFPSLECYFSPGIFHSSGKVHLSSTVNWWRGRRGKVDWKYGICATRAGGESRVDSWNEMRKNIAQRFKQLMERSPHLEIIR